jgi:hypothetical protein
VDTSDLLGEWNVTLQENTVMAKATEYWKAPKLSNGKYPTMDFYIAKCEQLKLRCLNGGFVERTNGQFVSGLMGVSAIEAGEIAASHFEEPLVVLSYGAQHLRNAQENTRLAAVWESARDSQPRDCHCARGGNPAYCECKTWETR